MDRLKAIQVIEKYKGVGRLLGINDDEVILDEIIHFIDDSTGSSKDEKNSSLGKNKYGESSFYEMISSEELDLSAYKIAPGIVSQKDRIADYWHSLSDEEKGGFTIFELNVILFLISNQYNKYQKKDKKRIIGIVNSVSKEKRMESSYNNIVV